MLISEPKRYINTKKVQFFDEVNFSEIYLSQQKFFHNYINLIQMSKTNSFIITIYYIVCSFVFYFISQIFLKIPKKTKIEGFLQKLFWLFPVPKWLLNLHFYQIYFIFNEKRVENCAFKLFNLLILGQKSKNVNICIPFDFRNREVCPEDEHH